MSTISSPQPLTVPKGPGPLDKRVIRNLDQAKISKDQKYEELKQKAIEIKLGLKPIELEYLKLISEEFSKAQKIFKESWKQAVIDYLKEANTNFNAREALRAAFKFVQGKKAHSNLDNKFEKFAKNLEDRFLRTHSSKKVIEFMARLGHQANEKAANPEFEGKHILLLGEYHVGLAQEDGSFYNPPTAWLEENLAKLKEAGYDTLALEVPYDVHEGSWLAEGNNLWNHSAEEHIKVIEKLRDEALEYFRRKNTHGLDEGVVLFVEKVNSWLLKKKEELKATKSISLRNPSKGEKEDTRARWLDLARKAHQAGFKIVTTDASRKATLESNRITYFFNDIFNEIKDKTDGLKLIENYLIYKKGLIYTARDLSMAKTLEQALKNSQGNVIGLYGASHTRPILYESKTTARKVLERNGVPTVTVAMEFEGIQNKQNCMLLDQRLLIQPHERPSIARLSDMPFAKAQILNSYRDFQVKDHEYQVDLKDNPTVGELAPCDAAMLFSIPREFMQKS